MKKILFTVIAFVGTLGALAQEAAAPAADATQGPAAPVGVGEYFGMSDGALFSFMTTIIIILAIGVTIMFATLKSLLKSDEFRDKFYRNKGGKTVAMIAFFVLGSFAVQAADAAKPEAQEALIKLSWTDFYVMLALVTFLIFQYAYYSVLLFRMFRAMRPAKVGAKPEPSVAHVLSRKLTGLRDIEEEKDLLMDHEYDGIQELDNSLPPWWKWGFYITIVWAIGYISYYHIFDMGELQVAELKREMREADEKVAEYQAKMGNMVDEFYRYPDHRCRKIEKWRENFH
jgi:cytochrome c oxidase cbb3-type subunit III